MITEIIIFIALYFIIGFVGFLMMIFKYTNIKNINLVGDDPFCVVVIVCIFAFCIIPVIIGYIAG